MRRHYVISIVLLLFALGGLAGPVFSQDSNITYSIETIEQALTQDSVVFILVRDLRYEGDKAKTAILKRTDDFFFRVKLKPAPPGGEATNNEPRYEMAAYLFQKLFLDEQEYVVPPNGGRIIPLATFRNTIDERGEPTFKGIDCVYVDLQYWLNEVTNENVFDKKRLKTDSIYSKYFANANVFSYLIQHTDANKGNFLLSTDPDNPRVFAVDNGMAFGNVISNRGTWWARLHIDKMPQKTAERLKTLTLEQIQETLSVVSQYKIKDDQLIPMSKTRPFNKTKGVRRQDGMIQFGLTEKEITSLYDRLQDLLQRIENGEIKTFSISG